MIFMLFTILWKYLQDVLILKSRMHKKIKDWLAGYHPVTQEVAIRRIVVRGQLGQKVPETHLNQ
jgi:hypothetical protein